MYRETEMKLDVTFEGRDVRFVPWKQQTFDLELTQKECGTNCSETDDVSVFFFLGALQPSKRASKKSVNDIVSLHLRQPLHAL